MLPKTKHSRKIISGQSEYVFAGGNRNCYNPFEKIFGNKNQVLLKIFIRFDPLISHLGIYYKAPVWPA